MKERWINTGETLKTGEEIVAKFGLILLLILKNADKRFTVQDEGSGIARKIAMDPKYQRWTHLIRNNAHAVARTEFMTIQVQFIRKCWSDTFDNCSGFLLLD